MKKEILETIKIEKETVSDDEYLITEVYMESGKEVEKGELLFSFETSKADVDVESQADGYLYHNLKAEQTVKVGDTVAYISEKEIKKPHELFEKKRLKTSDSTDTEWEGVRVSESAMELIKKHDLTSEDFPNSRFIREKDILRVVENNERPAKMYDKSTPANYNDILIIGGKGGAKMVIEAIKSTNYLGIKGIIDDKLEKGQEVMGVPVLGREKELEELKNEGYINIVLSFSSLQNLPSREKKYQELKKKNFQFPNIIHARATVEPSVITGEGNIVLANAMVGSDVELGNINYVNTGAIICHESITGANNHFAPNSVIAGRVHIGNNNLIGMCVTTYFEIEIGDNNIINNGFNVVKNIKNNQILKSD